MSVHFPFFSAPPLKAVCGLPLLVLAGRRFDGRLVGTSDRFHDLPVLDELEGRHSLDPVSFGGLAVLVYVHLMCACLLFV